MLYHAKNSVKYTCKCNKIAKRLCLARKQSVFQVIGPTDLSSGPKFTDIVLRFILRYVIRQKTKDKSYYVVR